MGAYINPGTETKEVFLAREAMPVSFTDAENHKDFKDVLLVVLVQNPAFSAAVIAFSENEKREVLEPMDPRPRSFFIIEIEKLWPVSNLEHYLKK